MKTPGKEWVKTQSSNKSCKAKDKNANEVNFKLINLFVLNCAII